MTRARNISNPTQITIPLTVSANISSNATISVGNTTVNATINSTSLVVGNSSVNSVIHTTGITANGAGIYSINATSIATGTLDTARLPATANIGTAINVGANVNLTTSGISVGNSTVNNSITSTGITTAANTLVVNTSVTSLKGRMSVVNGPSSVTLVTSNTGLGSSFFNISDANTVILNAARYGNSTNTAVRLGINYAISDGNGLDQFSVVGSKKAPVIELNADNGSISLFGESGTGSDYRAPTLNQGLIVNSAGYVLKPKVPAFFARGLSNPSTTSYVTTVPSELVFSSVTYNNGSHYSSSTGRFTAPVAGHYWILCSFLVDNDVAAAEVTSVSAMINGSVISGLVAYNYFSTVGTYYVQSTGGMVINLNSGDYVSIRGNGGKIHVGSETHFTGFLIG
jgi:hypothetical protein